MSIFDSRSDRRAVNRGNRFTTTTDSSGGFGKPLSFLIEEAVATNRLLGENGARLLSEVQ